MLERNSVYFCNLILHFEKLKKISIDVYILSKKPPGSIQELSLCYLNLEVARGGNGNITCMDVTLHPANVHISNLIQTEQVILRNICIYDCN